MKERKTPVTLYWVLVESLPLQWGRSGEGAEDVVIEILLISSPGFNGAAPGEGSGRHASSGATTPTSCRLQWGRSGEGAEEVRPSRRGRSSDRFNGAAPVKERKTWLVATPTPPPASFNGAAPVKERKTRDGPQPSGRGGALQWGRSGEGAEDPCQPTLPKIASLGFNGAAPVKERKTRNGECLGPEAIASMGPLR